MELVRPEISSENSFYAANIRGENSLLLFILSKRFGWICGLVLLYVKLPWNFPLRFESFARPMLFATMATLSVSIVSMHLGSFTYITGSVANLPWSGRPQKLSMEANSVYVRTVHNKYWQKTSEFSQKYGNVTKILIVSAVTYQYSVFCCEM